MITAQGIKKFQEVFKGSDKFYLADPEKVTTKKMVAKDGPHRKAVISFQT